MKNLDDCSLSDMQKKALIDIHALTGCDQNSSFLRKGKLSCWKVLEENPYLLHAFVELGSQTNVSDDLSNKIEDFVCKLYGEKNVKDVDQARKNIFWRTLKKKKASDRLVAVASL